MKHTFTILLYFIAISFQTVFADAWTDQRNSCNLVRKKFKAVSMVKNCDVPWFKCRKGDTDCNFATSHCPHYEEIVPGSGVTIKHWAAASIGWRTIQVVPFEITVCCPAETEVHTGIGFCGGENSYFKPSIYSFSPILISQNAQNQRDVKLRINETIFDNVNRQIILKGISGSMYINSTDLANDFAAFTISVTRDTRPDSEEYEDDTKFYKDNLVWDARAVLNNGRLITNGNFSIADFTFNKENQDNNYIRVDFKREEMIINIPQGYDMEELVLHNGSDAGNLGFGISEKFEVKNNIHSLTIKEPLLLEDKFEFLNYPNPVRDKVSIQIQLKEASHIKVLMYDMEGNLITNIYEGKVKSGKPLTIEHDLKGVIPQRVYFLKLLTKSKTLIRKILVE